MRDTGSAGGIRRTGVLGGALLNLRLVWRLLQDGRVPLRSKALIPAALLYLVWPLDILVDLLPFLGQVDDLTAIVLAVVLFLRSAPERVVAEHRDALTGVWRRPGPRRGEADTIEGQYRVLDEEERR